MQHGAYKICEFSLGIINAEGEREKVKKEEER